MSEISMEERLEAVREIVAASRIRAERSLAQLKAVNAIFIRMTHEQVPMKQRVNAHYFSQVNGQALEDLGNDLVLLERLMMAAAGTLPDHLSVPDRPTPEEMRRLN